MRLAIKLFRPAANQNIYSPKLWQDPVYGYFETHGKMEFKPNEQYNLTDEEKNAVLWRYRVKEILKKEYLRREYNPGKFKYKEGAVIDPAMFRCYAAEMSQVEFFRATPKSVFLYLGGCLLGIYIYARLAFTPAHKIKDKCLDGEILWWDRQQFRQLFIAGNHNLSPTYGLGY